MVIRCASCDAEFPVEQSDLAFLARVSPRLGGERVPVPPPTCCPDCRMQRRMAWRNERRLFQRECSKTGAALVSMFPPDTPFPVYQAHEWWSDANEALTHGRPVDLSRSIFSQLRELQRVVPRVHTFNYAEERMVNSTYTNCAGDVKDCYLIFASARDEGCSYCIYTTDCVSCLDCYFATNSSYCYECADIDGCYTLFFSSSCKQCHDSFYLDDCRGCSDCIGCAGLRQKRHYILNQKATKEEVNALREELLNGGQEARARFIAQFAALAERTPKKFLHGDHNENSSGDHVSNTKNCEACFCAYNSQDCKYCNFFFDGRDCMDVYAWGEAELCYEVSGGGDTHYGCAFTAKSFGCKESYYLDLCVYSKNCFACIGLKHKQYCILNTEYSEEEYTRLVPKVIETMKEHGEWGEFFPASMSPWGYDVSIAADYFPLTKEEALNKGFSWTGYEAPPPKVARRLTVAELPARINECPDDILDAAIVCERSGRPFRLVRQELLFYRRHGLPLPELHPDERYLARMKARNPRRLWQRTCAQCGSGIKTSYAPARPEKVFCERCYEEALYGAVS